MARFRFVHSAAASIAILAVGSVSGQPKQWTGQWPDGSPLTRAELNEVLSEHREWVHSDGRSGSRADLSGAKLSFVDLFGDLREAILTEAVVHGANLSGTRLSGADLSKANLYGADLSRANLTEADLTGADLTRADLTEANLTAADLTEADLSRATVTNATFEPTGLPELNDMVGMRGLGTLTYARSPQGLARLRTLFREAGMRQQEREVTYAINRTMHAGDGIDAIFNRVMFDWTCAYGLDPGRPLKVLAVMIAVFALVYLAALLFGGRRSAVRVVPVIERTTKRRVREILIRYDQSRDWVGFSRRRRSRIGRLWRAVRVCLYFSILCAFRVGFREINVGNWLARMQCRQYVLRGTGWVRFAAGLQSLISVYLLALWVLSYWSRPFG